MANQAINPLKQAGEYLVRTFKPRGGDIAEEMSVAGQLISAAFKSDAKMAPLHEGLKLGGRGVFDYMSALDYEGQRGRLGAAAVRMIGAGVAMQSAGRMLSGRLPIQDESGRFDLPGLPFL